MRCPHCTVDFHDDERQFTIDKDGDGLWGYGVSRCSACGRLIIRLISGHFNVNYDRFTSEASSAVVRPKASARPALSSHVPDRYADDYREAALVMADSPKASAALSRRCLQHVLREEAKVKHQDLAREIQEVLDSSLLPSHIADSLDAIRNIGNFAAHPTKSKSSGEIVAVEAGEAEWTLDVLDLLFDFYFVAPAVTRARREALNVKLADAGKPPLK